MKEFWNNRYQAKEYAYGKSPNTFAPKINKNMLIIKGVKFFPLSPILFLTRSLIKSSKIYTQA